MGFKKLYVTFAAFQVANGVYDMVLTDSGSSTATWSDAVTYCANSGKELATMET